MLQLMLYVGMALSARPRCVAAGLVDTPLPNFADGKPSLSVMELAGVVKRLRLQTEFVCTPTGVSPVDVGVQMFDATGTLLNDVGAGVGALLGVQPGQTITIGTSATATFLESTTIPLADFSQGSARVVASAAGVRCSVFIVDDGVTPPVALGTLAPGVRLGAGSPIPGEPLPRFADGKTATHAAVVPGAVKRGRMETNVFCTSLALTPIDVGVQIRGPNGTPTNDLMAGNGAVLDVASGATVTIGTTGTAAFLETTVLVTSGVAQGLAQVISTSGDLTCSAMMLDSDLTPPTSMTALYIPDLPAAGASATPTATRTPTASRTPSATPSPTAQLMVSGHVGYYQEDRHVAGVMLELNGDTQGVASTDVLGAFGFNVVPGGSVTIRPAKDGELNDAVSSLDAAFVRQSRVGLRTLDAMQSIACDVTGDGTISSLDAARILQLRVGIITRFPVAETCGSDWIFVPNPTTVANQSSLQPQVSSGTCQPGEITLGSLVTSITGQDFIAILFGDCTGNWLPSGPLVSLTGVPPASP